MDSTLRTDFEQQALPNLDAMYGMALRLTRNPTEAEDLVQDASVRAYRFWHTFKPGTSIKAWLYTIVRNTFINRYHKNNRRRDLRDELESQLESLGVASSGMLNAAPRPDTVVSQKLTRERILGALDSIPEDYRVAVTLADLDGLAYKEIAEVMQCPVGTVMSRIYRGRKLLYAMLQEEAAELGIGPKSAGSDEPIEMSSYRKRGKA